METCQFSYISLRTHLQVTAHGIERAWDDLKVEFDREGPGIPGATYYKTISPQGPQLFAVVDENQVFYHDKGEWYRYITATDVKFGKRNTTDDQKRTSEEDPSQPDSDKFSKEEQDDPEDDD